MKKVFATAMVFLGASVLMANIARSENLHNLLQSMAELNSECKGKPNLESLARVTTRSKTGKKIVRTHGLADRLVKIKFESTDNSLSISPTSLEEEGLYLKGKIDSPAKLEGVYMTSFLLPGFEETLQIPESPESKDELRLAILSIDKTVPAEQCLNKITKAAAITLVERLPKKPNSLTLSEFNRVAKEIMSQSSDSIAVDSQGQVTSAAVGVR